LLLGTLGLFASNLLSTSFISSHHHSKSQNPYPKFYPLTVFKSLAAYLLISLSLEVLCFQGFDTIIRKHTRCYLSPRTISLMLMLSTATSSGFLPLQYSIVPSLGQIEVSHFVHISLILYRLSFKTFTQRSFF
jgi:hypothetical protein